MAAATNRNWVTADESYPETELTLSAILIHIREGIPSYPTKFKRTWLDTTPTAREAVLVA